VVYAQDVQSPMLDSIRRRIDREGFQNVRYIRGDRLDPKLPAGALDAVLMVDTYHEFENPVALLRGVSLAIKATGRVGIVDFRSDGGGPGPPFSERVKEERVVEEAAEAGLRLLGRETFLEFQYFLIFGR
jgi:ubiquinone/menaquinone biosynthesis C-methylase UbiE